MAKKSNHYVDNKKLYQCIVEYKQRLRESKKNGSTPPKIPEYAGECIVLIAENMAKRYHAFARYSYNDEMASDAILNCIKYFDSFDETKYDNPHAWFTKICYNANIQRIKTEKTNQYVKYKAFESELIMSGDYDNVVDSGHSLDKDIYDNISSYIDDYEQKEEEKKIKRKERLQEKKMKDSLDRFLTDEKE